MTSLERLENETETSRVRVAELLDELRARVSPGALVDQVVDFAGNGAAGDFARTLGRQVRNNPMASVLIGAGLAWLMLGDRRSNGSASSTWTTASAAAESTGETVRDMRDAVTGAGQRVMGRVGEVADAAGRASAAVSDSAHQAGDAAISTAYRARDAAMDATTRARDTASDVASRVGNAASGATSRARDAVADATSSIASRARGVSSSVQAMAGSATDAYRDVAATASDRLHGAAERARGIGHSAADLGARAGSTMTHIVREQPLITAGVGLAIGALIGAALPSTEAERRALGETSDDVKARARQAAAEQVEKAKRVAEQTYEAAKEQAGHVAEQAVQSAKDEGFAAGTLRAEHERNEHARPETK